MELLDKEVSSFTPFSQTTFSHRRRAQCLAAPGAHDLGVECLAAEGAPPSANKYALCTEHHRRRPSSKQRATRLNEENEEE